MKKFSKKLILSFVVILSLFLMGTLKNAVATPASAVPFNIGKQTRHPEHLPPQKTTHNRYNVQTKYIFGETDDELFGSSVSGIGDVNADGYDDFAVGAPLHDGPGGIQSVGQVYIYNGSTLPNSVADLKIAGEAGHDNLGQSVSGAGDFNGDGYDDIIIGANDATLMFLGGPTLDPIFDFKMLGEEKFDGFASSVSGAGDVNGDGYNDVIVGAPYNDHGGEDGGKAYIFFGGSTPDFDPDILLIGEGLDQLGYSVSDAGDFNGDGYDDVIVGAKNCCYPQVGQGRAFVFFGGPLMDSNADIVFKSEETHNYFGTSVSGAGDINGDGYDDVMVASPFGPSLDDPGIVHVFFGGATADNDPDLILRGKNGRDDFGRAISGAGDINGDGFDDMVVGARFHEENRGKSYIFTGAASPDAIPDFEFSAEPELKEFGLSVNGAGDVNGDGDADVIIGGNSRAYLYWDFED